MSRPPYLRRIAAVAIVAVSLVLELRAPTTARIPVAAVDLSVGAIATEAEVRWLDVAPGLVEPVTLPVALARAVAAGTPISRQDVESGETAVPSDWLRIELAVPPSTPGGSHVVAVISPSELGHPANGIVVGPPTDSGFDGTTALVAFPPTEAIDVATGLAEGTVTVLVGR